jgi:hypothetical protein
MLYKKLKLKHYNMYSFFQKKLSQNKKKNTVSKYVLRFSLNYFFGQLIGQI